MAVVSSQARTPRQRFARTLRRLNWKVVLSILVLAAMIVGALAVPLTELDPFRQSLRARLIPPAWQEAGLAQYPLGTDHLGRDMLSRLLYGARVSLSIGFLAVALAGTIGVVLGLLAGYFGGLVDTVIMRLADIQLAFPLVLIVILLVSVMGPSLLNMVIALGVAGWVEYTRLVRAEVLQKREEAFVEAARALGAKHPRIILRHVLPNIAAPILVLATLAVPRMILVESALSWLGLSVPPPTPTWGGMVAEANNYLSTSWWMATLPGVAIVLVVLSINFIGDWLRDVLDPRTRKR